MSCSCWAVKRPSLDISSADKSGNHIAALLQSQTRGTHMLVPRSLPPSIPSASVVHRRLRRQRRRRRRRRRSQRYRRRRRQQGRRRRPRARQGRRRERRSRRPGGAAGRHQPLPLPQHGVMAAQPRRNTGAAVHFVHGQRRPVSVRHGGGHVPATKYKYVSTSN